MSCGDNFVLVTGRRRGKASRKKPIFTPGVQKFQGEHNIEVNPVDVLRKVEAAKNVLHTSEFLESVLSVLSYGSSIVHAERDVDIVCYGLGHFTECNIARYQLALLLIFQENFKAVVYVHDPVFYSCEVNILESLSFSVIQENEEGKRMIKPEKGMLLYCPHCPRQLVNNFLWQNWGPKLKKSIIIGNSFSDIVERNTPDDTVSISFIKKIQPYTDEHVLKNNFVYTDIFNNMSIHMFPEDKLDRVEPIFWSKDCEQPEYPDSDTEFVRNQK